MLISLIEENKTTDMQSDPEDESPVIQFSVTPPQAPPNKKSPEARDAPAVATSKNNLSINNNDIGAYVCPIPAKRRKLSFLHIDDVESSASAANTGFNSTEQAPTVSNFYPTYRKDSSSITSVSPPHIADPRFAEFPIFNSKQVSDGLGVPPSVMTLGPVTGTPSLNCQFPQTITKPLRQSSQSQFHNGLVPTHNNNAITVAVCSTNNNNNKTSWSDSYINNNVNNSDLKSPGFLLPGALVPEQDLLNVHGDSCTNNSPQPSIFDTGVSGAIAHHAAVSQVNESGNALLGLHSPCVSGILSGLRAPLTPEQCVQDVSARAAITFSKENLAAYRASSRANASSAQVTISNFTPAAHMISSTNSSAHIASSAFRASSKANASSAQVTISNFTPVSTVIKSTNSSAYIASSASFNVTSTAFSKLPASTIPELLLSTSYTDINSAVSTTTDICVDNNEHAPDKFIKKTILPQQSSLSLPQSTFSFASTLQPIRAIAIHQTNVTQKTISLESKRRADHRATLSEAEKDRIRQINTKRKAEARAALKQSIPLVLKQGKPAADDGLKRKKRTATQIILRENMPIDAILATRELDSANRSVARANLSEEDRNRIRQLDTVQRATARGVERRSHASEITATLQDHALGTTMPTNEYCNLFEKDAHAAQARFAVGSGFNVHGDAFMNTVVDPETGLGTLSASDRQKLTNVGPLSHATILNAVDQFIQYTDPAQPIHVCGSCGMRGLSHNQQGKTMATLILVNEDGSWNSKKFGNKKSTSFKTLLELFEIDICIRYKYSREEFRAIRNFTVVKNTYLHLYNEYLVRNDDNEGVTIMLCRYCIVDIGKGVTPSHNLKYRDFGHLKNFQKIVLGGEGRSLSHAERTVCSPAVVFDTILKTTMTEAKFHHGHCITFLHEGPPETLKQLPRTTLQDGETKFLSMAFVGATEEWNMIGQRPEKRAQFLKKQSILVLRADRVKKYLEFKCKMDPNYIDLVTNTSNGQSIEELAANLKKIQDEIFETAIVCDEEEEVRLDRDMHDNVANELDDMTELSAESLFVNAKKSVEAENASDFASVTHISANMIRNIDEEAELDQTHVDHVFISPEVVRGTKSVGGFLEAIKAGCDRRKNIFNDFIHAGAEYELNELGMSFVPEEIDPQLELLPPRVYYDEVFQTLDDGTMTLADWGLTSRPEEHLARDPSIEPNIREIDPQLELIPPWLYYESVFQTLDDGTMTLADWGLTSRPEEHLAMNPSLSPSVYNVTTQPSLTMPSLGHYVPQNSVTNPRLVHPVRIGTEPMSEYGAGSNQNLLLNAFADLFLLGEGLGPPTQRASLSQRDRDHLLHHADGRFGQSAQFIFLLFNQMQRSSLAAQVSVKVRGDSASIKGFLKMANAPGFMDTISNHISNSGTNEAKQFAQSLNRVTKTVNEKVPWSEHQRSSYSSKLLALISYAGAFSYFITIAPGQTDSILRLRIYTSHNLNETDLLKNVDLPIPSYSKLAQSVSNDPVAAAIVYQTLVEAFLCFLVGRGPSYLMKRDVDLPPTGSQEAEHHGTGIFGKVIAYGMVNEEQHKGNEHGHLGAATDTGPMTLLKYLNDPDVIAMLASRMDSIVQAYIPNRSYARFLSNVLSTKAPAADDKNLPTRRDQRYGPYQSHDNETINASISTRRAYAILKAPAVQPEAAATLLSGDDVIEDGVLPDSAIIASRKDTMVSEARLTAVPVTKAPAPKAVVSNTNNPGSVKLDHKTECKDDDPWLLAELERDPTKYDLLMRRALACAVRSNIHAHSFTCHKPPVGLYKCRMGYPKRPSNHSTGLFELERDVMSGRAKARTHFSVKPATDSNGDPLQNVRDDRVIIMEMFRPTDDYDEERKEEYETCDENQEYWADFVPGLNSDVVSFSPALTALFASNTNVEVLGNFIQSKGATYYIIKYMTKDAGKVQTILPVLMAAQRKITKYPSRALDSGTEERTSKHLLNVLLNSLNGKVEVGVQTAALALLGYPSNVSSHDFGYAFIRPLMSFIKTKLSEMHIGTPSPNGSAADDENRALQHEMEIADDPFVTFMNENHQDDRGHQSEIGNDSKLPTAAQALYCDTEYDLNPFAGSEQVLEDDEDDVGVMEIIPAKNPGDAVIATCQSEHYWFRGEKLSHFGLYDYIACVRLCPKPSKSKRTSTDLVTTEITEADAVVTTADTALIAEVENVTDNADDDRDIMINGSIRGRQSNAVFELDTEHPLHKTHCQRLRSKQLVPIMAGAPQPRHPGPFRPTAEWRTSANNFARYMLTLFRPISAKIITDNPDCASFLYEDLVTYTRMLMSSNEVIDKARLFWLKIGTHGMTVKSKDLNLLSLYRGSCTKYWRSGERSLYDEDEHGYGEIEADPDLASEKLKELQDIYGAWDEQVDPDKAQRNLYYDRCIDTLTASSDGENINQLSIQNGTAANDELLVSADNIQRSRNSSSRFADDTTVPEKLDLYKAMTKAHRFDSQGANNQDPQDQDHELGALSSSIANQPNGSFLIDETPPTDLNVDQQLAYRLCIKWYNETEIHRSDPIAHPAPENLQLIITGAAGTGKTYFIKAIKEACKRGGSVVCTAPTGVAATLLKGKTVDSAFSIYFEKKEIREPGGRYHKSPKRPRKKNNTSSLQEARFEFTDSMRFLVIDEFSMLEADKLSTIETRLREWSRKDEPFGGVAILLMGDPFQLFPAVGKSLISACMAPLSTTSSRRNATMQPIGLNRGGHLFNQFKRIDFTISQRFLNEDYNVMLQPFRSNVVTDARPVESSGILRHLRTLKRSDFDDDPEFKNAVIVVSGNEQRMRINCARAVAMAKSQGKVVIAWRYSLCNANARVVREFANSHNTTVEALLQNEDELTMYFVQGAPAVVTDNISTELGIANGTTCRLHSLVLDPDNANSEDHWANMDLLAPGEIYWLPSDELPVCINVEFTQINVDEWDPALTLIEGSIVIPLPICNDGDCREGKAGQLLRRGFSHYTFWIDLGFCVTYYKVQGQTIDRVILDLNHAGGHQKKLDLAALYVGLSRVRDINHIRVLPFRAKTITDLHALKFRDCLVRWCKESIMATLANPSIVDS